MKKATQVSVDMTDPQTDKWEYLALVDTVRQQMADDSQCFIKCSSDRIDSAIHVMEQYGYRYQRIISYMSEPGSESEVWIAGTKGCVERKSHLNVQHAVHIEPGE